MNDSGEEEEEEDEREGRPWMRVTINERAENP